MSNMRKESDSLGVVEVPADKLWGAQTQRSLEHFSIGKDLIPREMITAYATLKKAAATANHAGKRHAVQYERERSDLQPLLSTRGYAPRKQGAGSPQRSRQHGAVVQRLVSVRDVYRGGGQCEAAPDSSREGAQRRDRGEGRGVEGHHQDRPDPYAGRYAAHPRAGMVRLRGGARGRSRADRNCAGGRLPSGARRHGGGHRHQLGAR